MASNDDHHPYDHESEEEWLKNTMQDGYLNEGDPSALQHDSAFMQLLQAQADLPAEAAASTDHQETEHESTPLPPDPQEVVFTGQSTTSASQPNLSDQSETLVDQDSDEDDQSPRRKLTRKHNTRSRRNYEMSFEHGRLPESFDAGNKLVQIGEGVRSGCDHFVLYGKDKVPRLKYKMTVGKGKEVKANETEMLQYPDPMKTAIPAKTSLKEICQQYPRHVGGKGLRLFMSEDFDAREIYESLPEEFRQSRANGRKWNSIQAAMGRQQDDMVKEDGGPPKTPSTRKTSKRPRAARDEDDDPEDQDESPLQKKSRQARYVPSADAHTPPAQAQHFRPRPAPMSSRMTMQQPQASGQAPSHIFTGGPPATLMPPLPGFAAPPAQARQQMPGYILNNPGPNQLQAAFYQHGMMAPSPSMQPNAGLTQFQATYDQQQRTAEELFRQDQYYNDQLRPVRDQVVGWLERVAEAQSPEDWEQSDNLLRRWSIAQMWNGRLMQFVAQESRGQLLSTGNSNRWDFVGIVDMIATMGTGYGGEVDARATAWSKLWAELERWVRDLQHEERRIASSA